MSRFDAILGADHAQVQTVDEFAQWTRDALSPLGFSPENSLPIVGVCRDELMFPVEQALHDVWGPAFDASSLGAMVFLGRSGLDAAAHHAPGRDGRRRFVCVVAVHIGIDADGHVGRVLRDGQDEPSTACGALAAFQAELAAGRVDTTLDWDDLEMSLLRAAISPHLDATANDMIDLAALTELARSVATNEIVRLANTLIDAASADVAVISAVLIHATDGDYVAVKDAWAMLGSRPERLPLLDRLPTDAPNHAPVMTRERTGRVVFAATSAMVSVGLVLQLVLSVTKAGSEGAFASTPARVVNYFSFFTVQSNILVAITTGMLAINPDRRSTLFRTLRLDAVLGIAVTGVVYHLALASLQELTGWDALADFLLHTLSPIACVAGWLAFGPRHHLSPRIIRLAVIAPLCWLAYALARGAAVTDRNGNQYYAYPFMNAEQHGYPTALFRCALVAALFLGLAFGAHALDSRLRPAARSDATKPPPPTT